LNSVDCEDGDSKLLQYLTDSLPINMVSYRRRLES